MKKQKYRIIGNLPRPQIFHHFDIVIISYDMHFKDKKELILILQLNVSPF